MLRPRPLPDPLHHGPFRYGEAAHAGVARSRLRAPDVSHPHRGLYVPSTAFVTASELTDRCEHLRLLLGEHHVFSHLTAARLYNMPLPRAYSRDEPLHVIALGGRAPVRRAGVVGWETTDIDLRQMPMGLAPVVSAADVWCQLAVPGATGVDGLGGQKRSLNEEWLVAVGDYLLTGPRRDGRRHPLCTLHDLQDALGRHSGRRGAKTLRAAIAQVRAPVHSPKETQLRLRLVAHGLPEPQVQVPVHTVAGLRHADLGYPEARLLLEYQGDGHRTDRRQWLEDLTRVQLFQDAGWDVMHIGAADVHPDCGPLAQRVRRALARRSAF